MSDNANRYRARFMAGRCESCGTVKRTELNPGGAGGTLSFIMGRHACPACRRLELANSCGPISARTVPMNTGRDHGPAGRIWLEHYAALVPADHPQFWSAAQLIRAARVRWLEANYRPADPNSFMVLDCGAPIGGTDENPLPYGEAVALLNRRCGELERTGWTLTYGVASSGNYSAAIADRSGERRTIAVETF